RTGTPVPRRHAGTAPPTGRTTVAPAVHQPAAAQTQAARRDPQPGHRGACLGRARPADRPAPPPQHHTPAVRRSHPTASPTGRLAGRLRTLPAGNAPGSGRLRPPLQPPEPLHATAWTAGTTGAARERK